MEDDHGDARRGHGGRSDPEILIVDDFYRDPSAIRSWALNLKFVSYVPPDENVVGPAVAAENAHRRGPWRSTAFVVYHGKPVQRPFYGMRYNPPEVRAALESLVGERARDESWHTAGDYWNGAFHLLGKEFEPGEAMIHHHHKLGDLESRGWSGVVYLSPDAPPSAGTSFWRKKSGDAVAGFNEPYALATEPFELIDIAENRYNRLVLFRENVWHRVEHGFGAGQDARLTQTFFFEVG